MKLAWLTDIHLNFIDEYARKKFYKEIVNAQCDGVLISGDIAEASCLGTPVFESISAPHCVPHVSRIL